MAQFIGIEAGGTKFVCAVGNSQGEITNRIVIPTEGPDIILDKVIKYIAEQQKTHKIEAIGIACFGPLDLDEKSPTYGYITSTPKMGWQNCDIVGKIQAAFNLPIGFDTDVNAAALGEHRFGAAQKVKDFIYMTVGTGIGAGAMINGKLLHGALHPEMGHMLIPQAPNDVFSGVCPYHKNCLEGLASGPAMMKRWSVDSALYIPDDHEAWNLEAYYLAAACMNYTLTLSPQKIVIGGGVMKKTGLFIKIRTQLPLLLNHYIKHPNVINKLNEYIVPAALGDNAGLLGAISLAEQQYQRVVTKVL